MGKVTRYSKEVRERAVRLVFQHEHDYEWELDDFVDRSLDFRQKLISQSRTLIFVIFDCVGKLN